MADLAEFQGVLSALNQLGTMGAMGAAGVPPGAGLQNGAGGGQPNGSAAGAGGPEGRPPSGQATPNLESKDGGTRQTVTESH